MDCPGELIASYYPCLHKPLSICYHLTTLNRSYFGQKGLLPERLQGTKMKWRLSGPFGALIPVFETRVDGPYSYLNENKYLSSDPAMSGAGVSITFHERE